MTAKRLVILLSGGIESIVTAAMAADSGCPNRHALFVDYGQLPREQELKAVRAISRAYGMNLEIATLRMPFLERHDMLEEGGVIYDNTMSDVLHTKARPQGIADRGHVVPYRNLIFMSLAAAFADSIQATQLWCGFDYRPDLPTRTADKSPEFVEALDHTLQIASENSVLRIKTLLQGNSKVDTIRIGHDLGVDWSMSWSCYNAFNSPCGVCAQCLTRQDAFKQLGINEGVEYCSLDFIREQLA